MAPHKPKLAKLPKPELGSAIADLIAEYKKTVIEKSKQIQKAATSVVPADLASMSREEIDVWRSTYSEQLHYYNAPETEVDRIMKDIASQVPQEYVRPIEECREFAKSLSGQIFKDWRTLNTVLIRGEEFIRKRWKKTSRTKKQAMLLEAWPSMNARHRPDMEELELSRQVFGNADVEATDALVWPYINLEDLLRPNALLIFLNSRGRHLPDSFAYSDLELAPAYKIRKEFLARRKDNFTMAFIGRKSAHEYGAFIEWEDALAVDTSVKAGRTVHVDHGNQILSIQHGIWSFLCRCVGEILREVDEEMLFALTVQPEPAQLTENDISFTKLEIVAREAPYRLPSRLGLRRLQTLAGAQKSQAVDHAIALREDPGYFAEVVERYRAHRPELHLDKLGRLHEHAKDFPLYNKALRQMAADAHCAVFYWDHIHNSISKLRDLSAKYDHEITSEKDLPLEFFESFSETRFFIEAISLDLISVIKCEFSSSPPLRKYHFRANANDSNLRIIRILPVKCIDTKDTVLVRVLGLLRMFKNPGMRDLFTLHVLLDEFERLMQAEPHAKELITPHLASYISQLSIMSECLHHMHQFQPWARRIESNIEENRLDFMSRYNKLLSKWGKINEVYVKFEDPKICEVGSPKDGKFYYPVDKRRTRDTVNAMIAAEAALDAFWKAANANWLRYVGTTPTALVKHIIGERVLQRTSPWVEPMKGSVFKNAQRETKGVPYSFPEHSHDANKQITGSFNKLAVTAKNKTKTRGVTAAKEESVATQASVPTDTAAPTLHVDKRAFRVFGSLFHSPSSPNQPGEIAWQDFLHAMICTGFAAEKLQGSAWHFTPKNLDADRSIQFHEPHPGNKLPFTWARRYGRRLTGAFGWGAESFTLA